ncbi:MAG: arabinose isomerase [Candidatus Cyclobacteriaceae bacterium M3_2C_046]
MSYQLKIGLFGIGLDAYWPQFEGLETRLKGYLQTVEQFIAAQGVEVVNLGLIDTPGKALQAGHQFRCQDVDLIFLHVTTYALSSTVLPVVSRAGVPVIILNLSPEQAINYTRFNALQDRTQMTGEWLSHCSPCPVPEMASVFGRAGIAFHQVTGVLKDENGSVRREIKEWIAAAKIKHTLFHNRLGLMGHYYSGMLDIYSDLTQHLVQFGGHIELLEVDELTSLRMEIGEKAVIERLHYFREIFEVQPDCAESDLQDAARTSLALDKLVEKHQLGSLAYYYKGSGTDNEKTVASIILGNSILTARGIPVAGEYEVKNVQAMKILDSLGVGGSFTEYYAMDYQKDVVLMGHDGPGHVKIAQGKVKVKPLKVYHGKVGQGLSVEMSVKHGPVTLLSVVQQADGKLMLLTAAGESVPGPILEIGNTNSRYRFSLGARNFVEAWNSYGPAHHCAVGIGDVTNTLEKLGKLWEMKVVKVC